MKEVWCLCHDGFLPPDHHKYWPHRLIIHFSTVKPGHCWVYLAPRVPALQCLITSGFHIIELLSLNSFASETIHCKLTRSSPSLFMLRVLQSIQFWVFCHVSLTSCLNVTSRLCYQSLLFIFFGFCGILCLDMLSSSVVLECRTQYLTYLNYILPSIIILCLLQNLKVVPEKQFLFTHLQNHQ